MAGIDIRKLLTDYELDQMSRYLELVQESLHCNYEQVEVRYHEDMAREMGEAEAELLEDQYTDEYIEASQELPQLLLLSFVVTWYSFVEQKLLDLCEGLKLRMTVGPKDGEYFDKGIRRARKFLLKGRGYEINSDHWREITEVGRFRNQIVHEGKRLSWSYLQPEGKFVRFIMGGEINVFLLVEPALFNYLQKRGMIKTTGPFVEIIPSFDYCKSLIKLGRDLFGKLYADLKPTK
ncbi:MAG: hypothetical protein JST85_10145 [Acidobacteria bacterium]|nr:hypothetical protein [Acidobacteriota bacterium]